MRYTQYTHKVSIPMRKELYDFLSELPRGSRTDMGREYFLYVQALLTIPGLSKEQVRKALNQLCKGNYIIDLDKEEDHET